MSYADEWRRRRDLGLCGKCGRVRAVENHASCQRCLDRHRDCENRRDLRRRQIEISDDDVLANEVEQERQAEIRALILEMGGIELNAPVTRTFRELVIAHGAFTDEQIAELTRVDGRKISREAHRQTHARVFRRWRRAGDIDTLCRVCGVSPSDEVAA